MPTYSSNMRCFILCFVLLCMQSFTIPATDDFSFVTETVFQLQSGQLVVTGKVKEGTIEKKDQLIYKYMAKEMLLGIDKMEVFAKPEQRDIAYKNDYVAFTVSGLTKTQVPAGAVFNKKKR